MHYICDLTAPHYRYLSFHSKANMNNSVHSNDEILLETEKCQCFLTYQKYWSEKLGSTRPGGWSVSLVGGKTRTLSGRFCWKESWPYRWRGFCGGYWRLFGGMLGSLITKQIQSKFFNHHIQKYAILLKHFMFEQCQITHSLDALQTLTSSKVSIHLFYTKLTALG